MSASPSRYRGRSRSPTDDINANSIFVGGLSVDTDERTLRDFFESTGNIVDVKVVYDHETGRSRGFGFIKYTDQRDADDAVTRMDGKALGGRTIRCNIAKYSRGRGRGRGRGAGPYGGHQSYGGRGGYRGRSRSRSFSPRRRSPGASRSPKRWRGRPSPSLSDKSKRSRSSSSSSRRRSASSGGEAKRRSRSPPSRRTAPAPVAATTPVPPQPAAPAPVVATQTALRPPPPGEFKKELAAAAKREAELAARINALEAEGHALMRARDEAREQAVMFRQELQLRDSVLRQYRKWLSATMECSRQLLSHRSAAAAAEREAEARQGDLSELLTLAADFVQRDTTPAGRGGEPGMTGMVNSNGVAGESALFPSAHAAARHGLQNGISSGVGNGLGGGFPSGNHRAGVQAAAAMPASTAAPASSAAAGSVLDRFTAAPQQAAGGGAESVADRFAGIKFKLSV